MANIIEIIANRKIPTKISNLVLDATLSTSYEYVNEKTSYKVEEGSDKSDNIHPVPDKITIRGHFSSHPIRILEGQIPEDEDRVDLAHRELLKLAGRAAPKQLGEPTKQSGIPAIIDVVSGLRISTNMVITRLSIDDTPDNRNALNFTLTLEEWTEVSTEYSVINNSSDLNGKAPNIQTQSQKKVNTGVAKTEKVEEGSILYNLVQKLFGDTKDAQSNTLSTGVQQ